ncbi:hypothetical protein CANCADRAFT_130702 [Tortispora caseinolytica NRRL Y-17796]|uniref:Meiotic sister chromatid recombination protein 1 n=1 Tax=Tortispora caseinolytica NRRL Y-17796 TaxID=767744 RepID=A0A1E4TAZ3_9ASCO|nr:hypothetical protein CANCADRAFT_130702 [Tortispora caseinolytica NRRL Y-17796]
MKFSILCTAFLSISSIVSAVDVYKSWTDSDLRAWLADQGIVVAPDTPRKSLLKDVEKNWDSVITKAYDSWSDSNIADYLRDAGFKVQEEAEANRAALSNALKEKYEASSEWLFSTWEEAQLRSFLAANSVQYNAEATKDELVKKAQEFYANTKDTAKYPVDELYSNWKDSELRSWLIKHGVDTKDLSTREKLISKVRSNSFKSHLKANAENKAKSSYNTAFETARKWYESALDYMLSTKESVQDTTGSLASWVSEAWSENSIKQWAQDHGLTDLPEAFDKKSVQDFFHKHMSLLQEDLEARRSYLREFAQKQNILSKPKPKPWYTWQGVRERMTRMMAGAPRIDL